MNEEWHPFPRQEEALKVKVFEELFGGARGPGKTQTGIVWLLKPFNEALPADAISKYRALIIRKNATDLTDWIDRAVRMYQRYGAKLGSELGSPCIRFPSGAKFRLGHLKDKDAYSKYIGHEYQRMLIEELNQIVDESDYLKLISSCRSTIPGLDARVFATTNPGGAGHVWIKNRFIDVAPWGTKYYTVDTIKGREITRSRIFINATIDDNPVLTELDPGYILSIEALQKTDPELYKAWRFGDWNVFAGMFFKTWRDRLHITQPFIPYPSSLIVGGMDWGRNSKPSHKAAFCFSLDVVEKVFYQDISFHRCKTFLEVAGKEKNVKEWSKEIKTRLSDFGLKIDNVAWIRGDPAMFTKGLDMSLSIADQFMEEGITLQPASNDRLGGWEAMKKWLSIAPDGFPYWQIAANCTYLASSIPGLVYDDTQVEDLDSDGDDHGADCERYKHKHIRWIDGGSGAILTDRLQATQKLPIIVNGKQQGFDLTPFETASTDMGGSTRVIGGE